MTDEQHEQIMLQTEVIVRELAELRETAERAERLARQSLARQGLFSETDDLTSSSEPV